MTSGWLAAIGVIVAATFCLLSFAFRNAAYTRDLWWQLEFDAQAPRALRATVGVAVLAMSLAVAQLLQPPKGQPARPSLDDFKRAQNIIRAQEHPLATLALMGDKSLMFSAAGNAFIMFMCHGRSWVALSYPVRPRGMNGLDSSGVLSSKQIGMAAERPFIRYGRRISRFTWRRDLKS